MIRFTKLQESFQNLLGSMGVSADSTATDQTSLCWFPEVTFAESPEYIISVGQYN